MNLSQQKRERMLNFLNDLKEKNKSNVDVLKEINEIETELTSKKYGLVWEEHAENADEQIKENIPAFNEIKDKEIKTCDKDFNFLIEGDNLHVLYLLKKTHKGLIDLIYIDPPYNRLKDDFIYDDKYLEKEDGFKHSKWLSFMNIRLKLARELLSNDGVIFVSIDDNEVAQLKLLLDTIFGEDNYVGQYMWYKSATPPNLANKIKKNLEYVLCYEKKKNNIKYCGRQKTSDSDDPFTKPKDSLKVLKFKKGIINFKGEDCVIKPGVYGTKKYPNELLNDLIIKNGKNDNDVEFKNKFIWKQETLEKYINENITINLSKQLVLSYKRETYDPEVPPNLIDESVGVSTTEEAGKKLDAIFATTQIFEYPKPVDLIKYIISFIPKKNITVLDFFAGSGTTGQAVLELNNEDGGNRKFILCTNNENSICETITYPRIKCLSTGKIINGEEYTSESKTILFEEKLTVNKIKNSSNLFEKIELKKEEISDLYDSTTIKIKDNKITLVGIKKNVNKYCFNMKYYKTNLINKSIDKFDDILNYHTKELVQLENGIDIDDKTILIAFDNDNLKCQLDKIEDFTKITKLYISRYVMLNSIQKKLLKNAHIEVMPDYYFKKELKEKGLNWG